MKQDTICVHNNRIEQGVNTPIYTSTSYKYIGYDESVYPRYFNTENQKVVVDILCKLEKAQSGLIFSSGMAATSNTLLSILHPGDHILVSMNIYGGIHKLISEEFSKFGIEYDFIMENDIKEFEKKIKKNTKAVYTETPSNPLLSIIDLKSLAHFARQNKLISVVDNTFATPINQRPLEWGIDVVIHSGTKYLGGHSDLCFGAMLSSNKIKEQVWESAINFGGSLNALDCYLIERSLKTLALRVDKHNTNALGMAQFLDTNSNVSKVWYPGLKDHPNHAVARSQMNNGFGGMLSFELKNPQLVDAFLDGLTLIPASMSLGGVETIVCQPTKTSHEKMPPKERLKLGITDGLIRFSTGIENIDDLIDDIEAAFLFMHKK